MRRPVHVGLEERAARLRHLHAPAPAARGVCREFVELVTDYPEGVLPYAERRRFEALLRAFSELRGES